MPFSDLESGNASDIEISKLGGKCQLNLSSVLKGRIVISKSLALTADTMVESSSEPNGHSTVSTSPSTADEASDSSSSSSSNNSVVEM